MSSTSRSNTINVALLNVHYSANLGDGLLSECLAFGLKHENPHINTFPVDLAGRKTISTLGGSKRGAALTVLNLMPKPARRLALSAIQKHFLRTLWVPHYETLLANADCVVLGGGNLIVDQDLNFPVKINAALQVAQNNKLPVHIYGVGVGKKFSPKGLSLLKTAFSTCDLQSVTVRDEGSRMSWDTHFSASAKRQAKTVFDPGILTAMKWKTPPAPPSFDGPLDCAVGIIGPDELSYHGTRMKASTLANWYIELLNGLDNKGFNTALFSNGSPADNDFLTEHILPHRPQTPVALPGTPQDLAAIVHHAPLTIAFRLHALIPAASYGNKFVALEWDEKVRSFMHKTGNLDYSINITKTSAAKASELCATLLENAGPAPKYLETAQSEIRALAQTINNDRQPDL